MTSFFNANANAVSRSVLGVSQINSNAVDVDAAKDFFRLQSLYEKALNQIRVDIGYFGEGDFVNLNNSLTTDKYNNYLSNTASSVYYNDSIDILGNLTKNIRDPNTFNNYLIIMKNVLTGLQKGRELQTTNDLLTADISNNELGLGLINETLIYNFLLNRRGEFVPFEEAVIYTQKLDIKLWYSNYLQQHGPPPDGVFDVAKLSVIVDNLIVEGIISWEEFLSEEHYSL